MRQRGALGAHDAPPSPDDRSIEGCEAGQWAGQQQGLAVQHQGAAQALKVGLLVGGVLVYDEEVTAQPGGAGGSEVLWVEGRGVWVCVRGG